jgi:hypothetical protein
MINVVSFIRNSLLGFGIDIQRASTSTFELKKVGSSVGGGVGNQSLAIKIIDFHKKFGLFYENIPLRKELQIKGAWHDDLIERRPIQNKIYVYGNPQEVAKFHENMFFNELISGLWNYGYVHADPKISKISINKLFSDYYEYNKIYPADSFISTKPSLPYWGFGEGVITPVDVWHSVQAHAINDLYSLISKINGQKNLSFIEIGSGFGGLAEKLGKANIFDRFLLVDIPHNLVTAYYYLSQSFGEDVVELITSAEHLIRCLKNPLSKFILIPSSLTEVLSSLEGDYIFGNFGSFSEMNYETVEFYLNQLPPRVLGIVQINSNSPTINSSSHIEVISDDFPLPSDLLKVYAGKPCSSNSSGGRYKISLHIKDKFWT